MQSIVRISIILIALLSIACSTRPLEPDQVKGDDYQYTREYLSWMIRKKMVENEIVGLSIAVVDNNRVVWSNGFGFADEAKGLKANAYTLYRAGSITKLFTATAVMQLAERGLIDIDKPLQFYLPEFHINSRFDARKQVTPRLIMTHHSGLPSDRANGMWGDERSDYHQLPAQLQDEYLVAEPGGVFAYSNAAFSVLGLLVEKISGLPYADYIDQHILQPLSMHQSFVGQPLLNDNHAKGYYREKARPQPQLRDLPAGGLNSSVLELARFTRITFQQSGFVSDAILRPSTLQQMLSYQDGRGQYDVSRSMGLGWVLDERLGDAAGRLASHDGGTPMFSSQLLSLPKHKLAVVVMANSNNAGQAVNAIAEKALKLALQSKTGIQIAEPVPAKQPQPLTLAEVERLSGYWSTPLGVAEISATDISLNLQLRDVDFKVVRKEDGVHYLQYQLFGLFDIDHEDLRSIGARYRTIDDRELLVLYSQGRPRQIVAEKIKPQQLDATWKSRLGQYQSIKVSKYQSINTRSGIDIIDMQLVYRNGMLLLQSRISAKPGEAESITLAIQPLDQAKAVVHGLGRSKGDTVRFFNKNGQPMMSYNGFVLSSVE